MALKDHCVSITAKEQQLEPSNPKNFRTMDPVPMLLKISQLIQIIFALSERAFYYKKDCQTLAAYIIDLKPLFEELEENNSVLVGINSYALERIEKIFLKARDLLKECAGETSKSFMILQKVQILKEFHDISLELKSGLECLPLKSLQLSNRTLDQVQQSIKNLPEAEYVLDVLEEQILEELGSALELLRKGEKLNHEVLVKLADKLNLKSNQEILMEASFLEKEKGNCILNQDKQSEEVIDTLIILFTEMADDLAEQKHSQVVIGGISIPADFRCPLSLELMSDPVIVSSGQTYEREDIQNWIDRGIRTCPKTRQVLSHLNLIPNYTVKALIRNWCELNKVPLPGPAKIETKAMGIPPSSKGNIGNHENLHQVSQRIYSRHPYIDHFGAGTIDGAINTRTSVRSVRTRLREDTGATRRETRSPVGRLEEGRNYLQSNSRAMNVVDAIATSLREAEPMDGLQSHSRNASTSSIRSSLDDSPMVNAIEDDMQQSLSLNDSSPYVSDVSGELDTSSSTVAASTEDSSRDTKRFDWNSRSLKRGAADNNIQDVGSIPSSSRSIPIDGLSTIQLRVEALINDLHSSSEDAQRNAAVELRLLAKFNMENRIIIANCGAIPALVDLLMSTDLHIQENAVTSLLNLSINDNNKSEIAAAGAIDPLVHVLNVGTAEAKENAAATLYSLSVLVENRATIGQSGAIAPLVDLLIQGTPRGKKDAATALFNLSIHQENKVRIVRANAIRPLVKLMSDPAAGMVDKAVAVLANLASIQEGKLSIGEEEGIPALVEVLELGSQRGKENAVGALLHLCTGSNRFKAKVLQEGAIPPLVALTKSGTPRAKEKASSLLRLFREQRHTGLGRGGSRNPC